MQKCQETVAEFKELGNLKELRAQSDGHAVMPTIGMGVGGAGGSVRIDTECFGQRWRHPSKRRLKVPQGDIHVGRGRPDA